MFGKITRYTKKIKNTVLGQERERDKAPKHLQEATIQEAQTKRERKAAKRLTPAQ